MSKETTTPVSLYRQRISQLSEEQKNSILSSTIRFLESVDIEKLKYFVFQYAWMKAEEGEPAEEFPFEIQAYLTDFSNDVNRHYPLEPHGTA